MLLPSIFSLCKERRILVFCENDEVSEMVFLINMKSIVFMNSSGKRSEISKQAEWRIECRFLINLLETSTGYYQDTSSLQWNFYPQAIKILSYMIHICKSFSFQQTRAF